MSITVSTPLQICNSPLNNSKSKMLFSFPRASRDNYPKKTNCGQAFYDLPTSKMQRSTSFGIGGKFDFTRLAPKTPAPTAYSLSSEFQGQGAKKKGFCYSFGTSRENMVVTGGNYVGDKCSPGPAAYDTRETGKPKISYSLRPRTSMNSMIEKKAVPGPGTYKPIEAINERGRYQVSNFGNSCATLISPARSKRFTELKSENPGPGAYDLNPAITENGSYFVSKFRSSMVRTFGHGTRKDLKSGSFVGTPGPGNYRLPSDFGYYESSKPMTTPQGTRTVTLN